MYKIYEAKFQFVTREPSLKTDMKELFLFDTKLVYNLMLSGSFSHITNIFNG